MAKEQKIPKSPAACADLLYTTREKRYELQREAAKLEELETKLEEFFVNGYSKDSNGIAGKVALVQIKPKRKPIVEDWPAFYTHIRKTGEWELMQRRINDKAVEERWDAKKKIPGVGSMQVKKVSCTKLK